MTSERTIITIIIGLILIGTISSVCGTVLLWSGKNAEGVFYLAATAAGSLASLLAKTDVHHEGTTATVTVETPAKEKTS